MIPDIDRNRKSQIPEGSGFFHYQSECVFEKYFHKFAYITPQREAIFANLIEVNILQREYTMKKIRKQKNIEIESQEDQEKEREAEEKAKHQAAEPEVSEDPEEDPEEDSTFKPEKSEKFEPDPADFNPENDGLDAQTQPEPADDFKTEPDDEDFSSNDMIEPENTADPEPEEDGSADDDFVDEDPEEDDDEDDKDPEEDDDKDPEEDDDDDDDDDEDPEEDDDEDLEEDDEDEDPEDEEDDFADEDPEEDEDEDPEEDDDEDDELEESGIIDLPNLYRNRRFMRIVESNGYDPNTVGSFIKLLQRYGTENKMMIRMELDKYEMFIVDIYAKLTADGPGCVYVDIAKGSGEEYSVSDFIKLLLKCKPDMRIMWRKLPEKAEYMAVDVDAAYIGNGRRVTYVDLVAGSPE